MTLDGKSGSSSACKNIHSLIAALSGVDESERQRAVACVTACSDPAAFGLLVDEMVKVLRKGDEDEARAAVTSLVQLGSRVVPTLALHLMEGKKPLGRARVATALGEIGRVSERQMAAYLAHVLSLRCELDPSRQVQVACVQALTRLSSGETPEEVDLRLSALLFSALEHRLPDLS